MAIGFEQATAAEVAADGEEAVRHLQSLFRSRKLASRPLLGDPIKKRFHGRVGAAVSEIRFGKRPALPRVRLLWWWNQFDFATTGYATPWGDQRGELRLSPLETPWLRIPRQDRGE